MVWPGSSHVARFHVDIEILLFVTGRLSKLIDPLLCHLHPLAHTNFGPNRTFHFCEIIEDPHDPTEIRVLELL